ncbi:MAG TPA: ABC transporter permease, partial [Telluria sp.]|nr:ABC transporter permease [Telluria sp.]
MEIRPILSALMRSKTGAILVALQVAISLAILANALHIVNLRQAVANRPSGVENESTLIYAEVRHLRDTDHNAQLAEQKAESAALRAVSGVVSVARVNQLPLTNSGWNTGVAADRKQVKSSASTSQYVTPDSMVKTLGLKLVEGRDFRPEEVKEADSDKEDDTPPNAVIVTRALAKKVWPNDSSYVGKTLYYGTGAEALAAPVVGVVETLQSQSAQVEERGEFSAIIPERQTNVGGGIYAMRVEAGQADRLMKEAEAALLRDAKDPLILRVKT